MFKVEKTEYQNRTFRLPVPLIEKLGAVAQEKNISVNKLVILMCEYALENLESGNNE